MAQKICPGCGVGVMEFDSYHRRWRCYNPECRKMLECGEHPDNREVRIKYARRTPPRQALRRA